MKAYWFFRRPVTEGVRCIVLNGDKVLLIQHTYGSTTRTTVGGGIHKGESVEEAVLREVMEEVGIKLTEAKKVGEVFYEKEFKKDTIHVFVAETSETILDISSAEILTAEWHSLNNIPNDTSPLFKKFFELTQPAMRERSENVE